MPERSIAAGMVWWTLTGARVGGYDIPSLLRRAGIRTDIETEIAGGARVPRDRYAALLRSVKRVMCDEFLGLCSQPVPPGTFAGICWTLIRCATLGDALQHGLSQYRRQLVDFSPRLQCQDGLVHVRIFQKGGAAEDRVDIAQAFFIVHAIQLIWWLVDRRFPLQDVHFRHAATGAVNLETNRLLRTHCLHLRTDAGFSFDASWLNLPIVRTDEDLREFLLKAPDSLLTQHRQQQSASDCVRALLRKHIPGTAPSLDAVAAALHLTSATLNRRLRDEGVGFQSIKDSMRCEAATRLLRLHGYTVSDVAHQLGFSELSTFSRAFKKWTGMAPEAFRRVSHEATTSVLERPWTRAANNAERFLPTRMH